MSQPPLSFPRDAQLGSAVRAMKELHIRHLLVRESDTIVGIVSERELNVVATIPEIDSERGTLDLAMTPDPYAVSSDEPLKNVIGYMYEHKIGSAVVIDDGNVVGLFTTTDALRALKGLLDAPPGP